VSTINPNQGIIGSDQTIGQVMVGSENNPQFNNQLLDLDQFLFFQNEGGLDGSNMAATGTPGEYLLRTQDGQSFKVINTAEIDLDASKPIMVDSTDNPNLMLGGSKDIDITGSDVDNKIMGNLGDNTIDGGKGNDLMGGGAGDDHLLGGEGNDQLIGGEGNDQLIGGEGDDVFAYPHEVPPGEEPDQNYNYGDDVIGDFGTGADTLILGDFNGDGLFDSKDYRVEGTDGGALITFIGADGVSRGSVLLQGVDANQLNFITQGDVGAVTLSDTADSLAANQLPEMPEDDDDDDVDDTFFTIV